ncbi:MULTISPECIES: phosphoribosylformylglycinamidine synthase subunit PurS [Candidatus Nitrosocaldus]|jgi:phosphoribosylformylglycinamidine synthase|uniref:Phosphoribosylformylglycinamidine synthase subunit PurS n=1 Tax=Candidatus Nitrosocaldus cavascurensis TaxID=2058097 RepID=A0A2K5AQU2_9ARCH|nr:MULTISPECIES: phosphoribosylformylglycinamidine synthase subunit PurS [Candidatus Nitrosocaldus]GBC74508.1 Phosphoribosylformylglycinamidine synthase subunit PurS [archaeon HR05]SPC34022.1 Phosphoribosylformylglycinamidine synthase subunit PurS [Candidatus Nitrosocaldus cavascurensis]
MPVYKVNVLIENKPYISDPEGDTILKDLVLKGGYQQVRSIRVAKMLKVEVEAKSVEDAREMVRRMCDELRLYNPMLSICRVE